MGHTLLFLLNAVLFFKKINIFHLITSDPLCMLYLKNVFKLATIRQNYVQDRIKKYKFKYCHFKIIAKRNSTFLYNINALFQ